MKDSTDQISRRHFLKRNSVAFLGVALSAATAPGAGFAQSRHSLLYIKPRYHRWHVDPGVEWLESNTGYATLDWKIPLPKAALVLVDVWQRHYLKDTEERGEKVIQEKLVPLLARIRQTGMKIIHAPSPEVAVQHPNWVKLVPLSKAPAGNDDWPPKDFRNLSGDFKQYGRPYEPREEERQRLPELTFHPRVLPAPNEAVIATGEELHQYCRKEGILFLLFAGFNTNACILSRDYGTIQMSNRGYQVVLIRDCTTGMESRETKPTMAQTRNAVLLLEMFGQYSITADEVIQGFTSRYR